MSKFVPSQATRNDLKAAVSGISGMKQAFRAATPEMQAQFSEATELTMWAVKRDAASKVAVDTGTLRDHIDAKFSRRTGFGRVGIKSGRVAIAGAGGSALKSAGARLLEASKYARMIEFGTVHATAQPFMLPAAEGQRGHYAARLRAAGKKAERNLASSRFA